MGSSSGFITSIALAAMLILSMRAWKRIPSESPFIRVAFAIIIGACSLALLFASAFRNPGYLSGGSVGIVVACVFLIVGFVRAEKAPQGW